MGDVQAAEGGADVFDRSFDVPRECGHRWHLARAHDLVVDAEAESGIIEHGGNVIRRWNRRQDPPEQKMLRII